MEEVKLLLGFLDIEPCETKEYGFNGEFLFEDEIYLWASDWNFLMEVVAKIEDTEHSEDNAYCVQIGTSQYASIIDAEGKMGEAIFSEGLPKIECVFNVCIEFVKMYKELY